jgi:hypothetical protein
MPDLIDKMYFQELSGQNPIEVCRRASCAYDETDRFYTVSVWDHEYRIYPHRFRVESTGRTPQSLHPYFDLFIIHYLLRAKEIEPAGQWISEKDVPGGSTFFRGPHAIPTHLISARFGNAIQGFKERCEQFKGISLDLADAAYVFALTSRIPVAVLYWRGDDEFPPESKILYDKTIAEHLAADIIYALAVGICERF